jgi:hypothetical protein
MMRRKAPEDQMSRMLVAWRWQRCAVALVLLTSACAQQQQTASADSSARLAGDGSMQNHLSAADSAAGWRLLFDGDSPSAWRGYKTQSAPTGWTASGGTLKKTGAVDDIISREQFGDFELAFEWKLSSGGNAGVFYRATEEYDKVYWSGPEYQLLDDSAHVDGKDRLTSAAAAYGLYPAAAGVVKPAGQWNSSRIVVRGKHVEHWLNGTKVVEYELQSPDWEAKVKASKFGEWKNFGRATRGHIAFQGDHEGDLELRNLRIRELT